jgi:hypothetical protein
VYAVRGRIRLPGTSAFAELKTLIPLWVGPPVLEADSLDAFARPFLGSVAREFTCNFS